MATTTYFENIEDEIKKLLNSSKHSVKICVAWINANIYGQVLQNLIAKGVTVEIIYNNDGTNQKYGFSQQSRFKLHPISARGNSIMHNKFCIIDNEILITGSFNWSISAKKNFENIVVIKDEYKLIKSYLHEFYDLISHYNAIANNVIEKCNSCRSYIYNLAILGDENGKYDESKNSIWQLCVKNSHGEKIGEEYLQYRDSILGIKEPYDDDIDDIYDKNTMIREFKEERNIIKSLKGLNSGDGCEIHAIGCVYMSNSNEYLEGYDEFPEYLVNIFWKDMRYRKIIPDALYDDGGLIEDIIYEHSV